MADCNTNNTATVKFELQITNIQLNLGMKQFRIDSNFNLRYNNDPVTKIRIKEITCNANKRFFFSFSISLPKKETFNKLK